MATQILYFASVGRSDHLRCVEEMFGETPMQDAGRGHLSNTGVLVGGAQGILQYPSRAAISHT